MSEQISKSRFDSQDSLSKWAVLAAIGIVTILATGPLLLAKGKPVAGIEPLSAAPTVQSPAPTVPSAEMPKSKRLPRAVA
jgi:hypothetical protein